MKSDVIVIGGGPSGLMAAAAAAEAGAKVVLVDKGNKLGRKLAISGGGRCNVTNNKEMDELIRNIPGNGRFLYSALTDFGSADIIAFFEKLGIRLKEEDRGRMFPVSDKAGSVVDALIGRIKGLGVMMVVNAPVDRLIFENGRAAGICLRNGSTIGAPAVIAASGGKSVPHTGSTGDGYAWAKSAGHTITRLYPTEVPITSRDAFIRSGELQGLSLRNIELKVYDPKGKTVIVHEGDMIFTHFGISGPAVLRCSQFVVKLKHKFDLDQVSMGLDLFPHRNEEELLLEIRTLAEQEPKKKLKNSLKAILPERIIPILFKKSGIPDEITQAHLAKASAAALSKLMKDFPIHAAGTLSIEKAFVTGGGVNLKEVDPRTMQSKLTPGLFFCGEILDIHGYTGGYNITAAFSTGHCAGKHAARYAAEAKTVRSLPDEVK